MSGWVCSQAVGGDAGLFYTKCKGNTVSGNLADAQLAAALWEASVKVCHAGMDATHCM